MNRPPVLILVLAGFLFSPMVFAEGFCDGLNYSKKIEMPLGIGHAPKFSIKIPESWSIESGRKAGDRWILKDAKSKKPVAKFEWNLGNSDQRMLTEVLDTKMKLGKFTVTKYTVSTSPEASNDETRATATEGLITGYTFEESSKLSGLLLMSESYDKASCLETALEKIVGSIVLN